MGSHHYRLPPTQVVCFYSMRCPASPQLLLLLFLSLVAVLLAGIDGVVVVVASSSSVRFELLRGDQLLHHRHKNIGGFFTAAAGNDAARQEIMRARLEERRRVGMGRGRKVCESNSTRRPPSPPSFTVPVSSGAYTGTGQYFVRFQVGTPAQKFVLVMDTGSDLTWMRCRYKGAAVVAPRPGGGNDNSSTSVDQGQGGIHSSSRLRLFEAGSSKSFHPVGCSTVLCKDSLPFSLAQCPSPSTPCSYDYSYTDGSRAHGVFANESASVVLSPSGRRAKLHGIVVGCTSSFTGQSFRASDGVLGLGYSVTSFAARATGLFGGKFSYCLVDHLSPKNVSNYLVFGGGGSRGSDSNRNEKSIRSRMRYAELVLEPRLEPLYAVKVAGISIGGSMLADIPPSTWDISSDGGAIFDSGTSLTILAEPAYKSVTAALSRAMMLAYPRLHDQVVKPFDFCYNATTPSSLDESSVPRLVIHLRGAGGRGVVRMEPPVKSYVVDVAKGVKCLGFLSAPSPGVSTFGNILQQNHRWEFDVANRRLGFARSNC